MLSIGGSILYGMAALACLMAAHAASGGRGQREDARFWIMAAIFFGFLIVSRLSGLESLVHDAARAMLEKDGRYDERRQFQSPAAIIAIIVFAAAILAIIVANVGLRLPHGAGDPRRAIRWAVLGILLMSALITLRVISYHPIDKLLYSRIHANWFIDIGATALVALSAWQYRNAQGRVRKRRSNT